MAGRLISVISGWRLGVNDSESQFGPKSFTALLITFSFLNIFEKNPKGGVRGDLRASKYRFRFFIFAPGAGYSPNVQSYIIIAHSGDSSPPGAKFIMTSTMGNLI